jgi:hypothetical protein
VEQRGVRLHRSYWVCQDRQVLIFNSDQPQRFGGNLLTRGNGRCDLIADKANYVRTRA